MPISIQPIEIAEIVEQIQTKVEPIVQSALSTELNDVTVVYILLGMLMIFLFRTFFFPLLLFTSKIAVVGLFSFATYVMFFK